MKLKWTSKALADLERLHDFLAVVNPPAAARTVQSLAKTPTRLLANPRIGEQTMNNEYWQFLSEQTDAAKPGRKVS